MADRRSRVPHSRQRQYGTSTSTVYIRYSILFLGIAKHSEPLAQIAGSASARRPAAVKRRANIGVRIRMDIHSFIATNMLPPSVGVRQPHSTEAHDRESDHSNAWRDGALALNTFMPDDGTRSRPYHRTDVQADGVCTAPSAV